MAAPALLYLLIVPPGRWSHGWGVPMSTDTAFAVALIVMLGRPRPGRIAHLPHRRGDRRRPRRDLAVAAFYSGERVLPIWRRPSRSSARWRRSTDPTSMGSRPMSSSASSCGPACSRAGCTRLSQERAVGAFHSDPAPADFSIADDAGERDRGRRSGNGRRSAAPRAFAPRPSRTRRHPRPLRIAGGPPVRNAGSRSSYVVLPLFAFVNAGVAMRRHT